ncbi:MAG: UDP-glucose 4-epimerase GalE [Tissierellales bacterium]|nr:UDP-glucose 4-epimerase GalE [Tissierellales bacterium]
MKILVTGGLGFIGSHTCVELINKNHQVVVADNLSNSKIETLERIEKITGTKPVFYKIDVTKEELVEEIFKKHDLDGVIHFAGYKAVGESVEKPLEYYYNNVVSTMVLGKICLKHGVSKFVFSSSATVYGDQESPFKEDMELMETTNPYGETKAMSERILKDTAKANEDFGVSLLRYFNPVGAHESGLIGEDPNGIPNNLMPFITKVAKGELDKLYVFGNDYDTVDGTGVRDYIHVVDLAEGHVAALENLNSHVNIYNLGTGKGTSVLEMVEAFKKVNKVDVPYEIVKRRKGDIARSFADVSKAQKDLKWKAKRSVEDMVRDAWRFENI